VRQPVTISSATHNTRPVVTYTLIGVTIVVFLLQIVQGIDAMAERWGMWPIAVAMGGQWWRLITSAFLHGSFLHIAFNMYVLFALGPTLERILGHGRFIVLYLTAAFGASVTSYVFSDANMVSVGASGAIFGLMGALVVAGKRLRYDITQVLVLIGINIAIGFIAPGVDWRAHLGGLVAGAAVAALLVYSPRRSRTLVQVLGVIGVWAILIGVALWRTAQVQEFYAPVSVLFA
jgi:membrane associated rhomboid family serine protease